MKLGYGYWPKDGTLEQIIESAEGFGFDYAEVSLDYPWPDKVTAAERDRLRRVLLKCSFRLALHGPLDSCMLFSPRNQIIETALEINANCIKLGHEIGAAYYVLHIRTGLFELEIPGNRSLAAANCRQAIRHLVANAAEANMPLFVENDKENNFSLTPEEITSEGAWLALDVGHWLAGGRKYDDLGKLVGQYGDRIRLLHLHDCSLARQPARDHKPLGHGDIDLNSLKENLRGASIEWVCLETVIGRTEQTVLEDIRLSRNLIKQIHST